MNPTPIVAVIGAGVTGGRIAKYLSAAGVAHVAVSDRRPGVAASVARFVRGVAIDTSFAAAADVAVLAYPAPHAADARELLEAGVAVVSLSDDVDDVAELLRLDRLAQDRGVACVMGAAMSPGLSGLLARYLASQLHVVDEIHVASHGTGGPDCARQHHDALGSTSIGWHDGEWIERPGGAGRELCWFPEPVNAYDCYRAQMPDPLLLHHVFPGAQRISARMSATRRDRFTARLPMLSPPHREGGVGAIRVELRGGLADGSRETLIAGVAVRSGMGAAVVAARMTRLVLQKRLFSGVVVLGDERLPTEELLQAVIADGITIHLFNGVTRPAVDIAATFNAESTGEASIA